LLAPKSLDKDKARREFILNILLIGLIFLSSAAFLINLVYFFLLNGRKSEDNPMLTGLIAGFLIILFILSRKGKSTFSSSVFIFLFIIIGSYSNYLWGADLPATLLLSALVIVMAGILIDSKVAFLATFISGGSIILFTYLGELAK